MGRFLITLELIYLYLVESVYKQLNKQKLSLAYTNEVCASYL